MSELGVSISVSHERRLAQLDDWERTLRSIAQSDLKTDLIVVGHGHRIAKGAIALADEVHDQLEKLSR